MQLEDEGSRRLKSFVHESLVKLNRCDYLLNKPQTTWKTCETLA